MQVRPPQSRGDAAVSTEFYAIIETGIVGAAIARAGAGPEQSRRRGYIAPLMALTNSSTAVAESYSPLK